MCFLLEWMCVCVSVMWNLKRQHTHTHVPVIITFDRRPLYLTRLHSDLEAAVLQDSGWRRGWRWSRGAGAGEYSTWESTEDNLAQHLCFFILFFFRVPPFVCQKLIGGCWLFFTGCVRVFARMCVHLCVCVCACSRKWGLKRGRWRQMGEVGGRCSEKTWKSTPAPARSLLCFARPRVKITQFARSQETAMQSSPGLKKRRKKGGGGAGAGGVGGGGGWRQWRWRYFRVTAVKSTHFLCLLWWGRVGGVRVFVCSGLVCVCVVLGATLGGVDVPGLRIRSFFFVQVNVKETVELTLGRNRAL